MENNGTGMNLDGGSDDDKGLGEAFPTFAMEKNEDEDETAGISSTFAA